MPPAKEIPHWIKELRRLAQFKSQLYLHGNIKDTVLYPLDPAGRDWHFASLREALFAMLQQQVGGFDIVASFSILDGLSFADERGANMMRRAFSEMLGKAGKAHAPGAETAPASTAPTTLEPASSTAAPGSAASASTPSAAPGSVTTPDAASSAAPGRAGGRAPGGLNRLQPNDPLDEAFVVLRQVMANTTAPCAIIVEHASQLLTAPQNMPLPERLGFLRLLAAAQESQLARSAATGHVRRNLLVLVCDKLSDLPAWLYLSNPYSGSIEIPLPHTPQRQLFFDMALGALEQPPDCAELAELTDGLSLRELYSISTLLVSQRRTAAPASATGAGEAQDGSAGEAQAAGAGGAPADAAAPPADAAAPPADPKELIDHYKYGEQKSEWRSDRLLGKLAHAEEFLAQRVMGQDAAVAAVCDVLRRATLGLSGAQHSSRSKPRGVLFFAGPTGVGKTELAKSITKLVFGEDREPIRFDMSEYGQPHSDQRLLGAPPGYVGYEAGGQLTDQVRANPFSVLLFDEIEKAHPSILDKFLQILEDGRLTDGRGQTAFFSEAIVIFTSNQGAGHLDPDEWTDYPAFAKQVRANLQAFFTDQLNRPELLSRIGQNIVVFNFIRTEQRRQILEQKVLKTIARQVQALHGVEVSFGPRVAGQLLALPVEGSAVGGRGIGNLAETALLNPLSRELFTRLAAGQALSGLKLHITDILAPPGGAGAFQLVFGAEGA